ncbi:Transcription factor IIA alpha/beta subunit [Arabidopsis suecica]|uniref:Transcription factor IIA alpha/beta subunit n=1 Tax=Arabidopsis suecica TaxID=45249 RepID=A0A8T1XUK8_ARASU|nr:Transcription factor IIA alpha/beta subunit [Arabidopsis suecica]
MVLSTSDTSTSYNYVIDDVINKSRCELVYNGELEESVLSQIQLKWKTKMIQAGVISGTIETSSVSIPAPLIMQTTLQTTPPDAIPLPEKMSPKKECDEFFIPQQDGARDEAMVTEPNAYAPNDVDENEELLNEDDDDEEDDMDDDDMSIPHLVMCQFDKVKRCKNKWECKFNAGVMQINGKNVLFSQATGDFNF